MYEKPILFLVFNRPEPTALTFEAIRRVRPKRLFIAADGPRKSRADDAERCAAVRSICDKVDWECQVKTLYREDNLGCEIAVGEAITWFFEQVEMGVILEDDCLPSMSFFRFCDEMLDRYKDDHRIGVVTGNNFQWGRKYGDASYYFSKYPHVWGWATWRRAWSQYDYSLSEEKFDDASVAKLFEVVPGEVEYWKRQFRKLRTRSLNTWDIRWIRSLWSARQLAVTPQANLVKNIGFGPDATHTHSTAKLPELQELAFPLVHPATIAVNSAADNRVTRDLFVPPIWLRFGRRIWSKCFSR